MPKKSLGHKKSYVTLVYIYFVYCQENIHTDTYYVVTMKLYIYLLSFEKLHYLILHQQDVYKRQDLTDGCSIDEIIISPPAKRFSTWLKTVLLLSVPPEVNIISSGFAQMCIRDRYHINCS